MRNEKCDMENLLSASTSTAAPDRPQLEPRPQLLVGGGEVFGNNARIADG
jgi:hypothetical protein